MSWKMEPYQGDVSNFSPANQPMELPPQNAREASVAASALNALELVCSESGFTNVALGASGTAAATGGMAGDTVTLSIATFTPPQTQEQ